MFQELNIVTKWIEGIDTFTGDLRRTNGLKESPWCSFGTFQIFPEITPLWWLMYLHTKLTTIILHPGNLGFYAFTPLPVMNDGKHFR
ncbi:unnamed protein product [Hymenolepis diminuta]|uniref:Uncharacterized protein n=1 Tax=Hymenolepis diminuta TaxID=6216 RepID=A0A564XVH0_HYMDI|nr:unnamed protein product [Hymenolepis diminuta]